MKKWICCILCGMLVFGSYLVTGTNLENQEKVTTPINIQEEEYKPVIFKLAVTVDTDGTYDFQLDDQALAINNWTGEIHTVIVQVTIENTHNNTGSTNFRWRIAEFPVKGIWGWLLFWVKHGNVVPENLTIPQGNFLGTTVTPVSWSAADENIKVVNYEIQIKIDPTVAFEIDIWLSHKGNHDFSSIDYSPMAP